MDEARLEDKTFAPGYGEFFSGGGRTYEATALAVPADALSEPIPCELSTMVAGAAEVFDAAESKDWPAAAIAFDEMTTAWGKVESSGVPARLAAAMRESLAALGRTLGARASQRSALAAVDAAQVALDLELRYRPVVQVDLARFDLWARELKADASGGDQAGAMADVTTLEWIRDRLDLRGDLAGRVDDQLRTLEAATESGELAFVQDASTRLRTTLSRFQPTR